MTTKLHDRGQVHGSAKRRAEKLKRETARGLERQCRRAKAGRYGDPSGTIPGRGEVVSLDFTDPLHMQVLMAASVALNAGDWTAPCAVCAGCERPWSGGSAPVSGIVAPAALVKVWFGSSPSGYVCALVCQTCLDRGDLHAIIKRVGAEAGFETEAASERESA